MLYFRRRCSPVLLIVLTFLYLSPFCDLITGLLVSIGIAEEGGLGSPSQFLRVLILLFGGFFLSKRSVLVFVGLALYFLLLESTVFFWSSTIIPFMKGLNVSFKILFAYLFYSLCKQLIDEHKLTIGSFLHYFYISAFVYSVAIIIPYILGIGLPNYDEGSFGTKGFFASGNGLGPYLGIASSILLLKRNKSFIEYVFFVSYCISLVLLGTKASFLFLIVNLILFFCMSTIQKRILLVSLWGVFFLFFYGAIKEGIGVIYEVAIYRFENSPDFLTYILSGRNEYIIDAFNELKSSSLFYVRLLVGSGALLSFQSADILSTMSWDTLEMDLFDVLFMYGIVGTMLYLGILLKYLVLLLREKTCILLIFIAYSVHSILAGHILFNGMSVIAGIVLLIFINYIPKDNKGYYYLSHVSLNNV